MKPALDREEAKRKAERERQRKIFVGGLPKNLRDEKLELYFSQFGTVQKSYVVKDPYSGKTRGFGFVIFENDAGFEKARRHPNHRIEGQEVHIKTAQAKEEETGPGVSNEQGSREASLSPESPETRRGFEQHRRHRQTPGQPQAPYVHYASEAGLRVPPAQQFQPFEGHYSPPQPAFGVPFYSMTEVSAGERGRGYPPGPLQAGGSFRRPAGLQRVSAAFPGVPGHWSRPASNLFSSYSQRDCHQPAPQSLPLGSLRHPPQPQSLQGRFEWPQAPAETGYFEPCLEAPGYRGSGHDFVRPLPPPAHQLGRGGHRPSPVSDQAITSTRPHKPVPPYLLPRSERRPQPYFQHHPQVFNFDEHWKPTPATNTTLPSANTRHPHPRTEGQAWPAEDDVEEEGHLQRAPDF